MGCRPLVSQHRGKLLVRTRCPLLAEVGQMGEGEAACEDERYSAFRSSLDGEGHPISPRKHFRAQCAEEVIRGREGRPEWWKGTWYTCEL